MSETVHYTGKIKLIERLPNETLEEQCKRIAMKHGIQEIPKYSDSWCETICYDLDGEGYVLLEDEIYEVLERDYHDLEDDIFEAHENSDGTIEYNVLYYNGGCGFSEALEYALSNMKNNN